MLFNTISANLFVRSFSVRQGEKNWQHDADITKDPGLSNNVFLSGRCRNSIARSLQLLQTGTNNGKQMVALKRRPNSETSIERDLRFGRSTSSQTNDMYRHVFLSGLSGISAPYINIRFSKFTLSLAVRYSTITVRRKEAYLLSCGGVYH